jgi:hypothetical protein
MATKGGGPLSSGTRNSVDRSRAASAGKKGERGGGSLIAPFSPQQRGDGGGDGLDDDDVSSLGDDDHHSIVSRLSDGADLFGHSSFKPFVSPTEKEIAKKTLSIPTRDISEPTGWVALGNVIEEGSVSASASVSGSASLQSQITGSSQRTSSTKFSYGPDSLRFGKPGREGKALFQDDSVFALPALTGMFSTTTCQYN